jgi:predicted nucleic acid-binding protein
MRLAPSWLIAVDKSALVRLGDSRDAGQWANRIERGLVCIRTVTRLAIGYSARNAAPSQSGVQHAADLGHPVEYHTPAIKDRAVEVQQLLASRVNTAQHQFRICSSPPPPSSPA